MPAILGLYGPNRNLLGQREPGLYGSDTLEAINQRLVAQAEQAGIVLACFQSNHEGALVDRIHQAGLDGTRHIIINPAAYTHTSVAILDALNAFDGPVLEVHVSNIHKRDAFRHHSYVSLRSDGVIAGFGTQGYQLGLRRIAKLIDDQAA